MTEVAQSVRMCSRGISNSDGNEWNIPSTRQENDHFFVVVAGIE